MSAARGPGALARWLDGDFVHGFLRSPVAVASALVLLVLSFMLLLATTLVQKRHERRRRAPAGMME